MSRIGKKPIVLPKGVQVSVSGGAVSVKGPKGELRRQIVDGISLETVDNQVLVSCAKDGKQDRAFQGLTRALVANMVEGVANGFQRALEINGVGYRAEVKGDTLNLALGYSHPIEYPLPQGISVEVEKQTKVFVRGIDKELVGATAAKIRSFRGPEPYKGKGIKYAEERIVRKAGKAGKK
ncbi:50S ribosomal protein L6 [Desulfuromonas sp. CSMB_57]|jgi:large subunit ribosomal protein L6|uniref:50S ribosomal protein L6 n=1 Tax=Desulfuromonas sp. CSMB_57 TaxID=2807629 RepID=UPI001CD43349|nr:50S ribosomal protein L6 [Desulfuromonas sp. CSMB_57]